ncbi:hypothetical protein NLJ89_g3288 [Agrocybe chaxingu]|uniref:F-box domain-containing protein n=1 Tax=Agrocybe chaxingu TaxID=84603 RepID=A0A9W8K2R4_9AGAR|nr:hypothetical protein NLJ89_g3288 [Agrocybe chaxingu]
MPLFDFVSTLFATRAWPLSHPEHTTPTTAAISTPAVPAMPLELVLTVIETACADADSDEDRNRLLSTCSLVCKAWSTASQRLLFSSITLRSQSSFQLFMNAADRTTDHGRTLGDAVKRMRVVLDHNQPFSLHHHSFALAVTVCPNIQELDIALYGCAEPGNDVVGVPDVSRLRRSAPSFDEQTISLLKSGPSIKTLHFSNWSENQQSIFQLLDIWPSLQTLSIGGTAPQHLQDSPPPFPCALEAVRFNFQSTPSADFMKWLLHNSAGSLRSLHFDRDPCIDVFEYLVNSFGSQLESMSFPGFASLEYASLIPRCTRLRELRTETPSCPSAFYKHLPGNLDRLVFGLDHETSLNSIIDFVKTHDTLKNVEVLLWEGGLNHSLLPPLKMACALQGTELTISHDLQRFRATTMMVSLLPLI